MGRDVFSGDFGGSGTGREGLGGAVSAWCDPVCPPFCWSVYTSCIDLVGFIKVF